ncbi:MAG: phosphatidate cytidylyltransferase [Lachnospiraceae bacterium]|nr:phosphatidate cytidylyltransferase [Lachnospiraceae bacterium]
MFITRTISGAVLLAITILMVVLGGPVLMCFLMVVSLVGMFELYRVFGIEKKLPAYIGYAGALALYQVIFLNRADLILAVLVMDFLLIMAVYVFTYPKFHASEITPAFFALVYAALMLSFIYRTREGADGAYVVWLIYISAWGSDTCAYLVGRAIGKHKMAPVLSPKKSVEGAVGGVAGAALIGLIYAAVFQDNLTAFGNPMAACALIGACGSLISMVGDLAASAIKRNYEIKDYGKLIPGHGGIMDRFDSIIFTAPVIFYLVQFLQTM